MTEFLIAFYTAFKEDKDVRETMKAICVGLAVVYLLLEMLLQIQVGVMAALFFLFLFVVISYLDDYLLNKSQIKHP